MPRSSPQRRTSGIIIATTGVLFTNALSAATGIIIRTSATRT